jgi:hypothetical protein
MSPKREDRFLNPFGDQHDSHSPVFMAVMSLTPLHCVTTSTFSSCQRYLNPVTAHQQLMTRTETFGDIFHRYDPCL